MKNLIEVTNLHYSYECLGKDNSKTKVLNNINMVLKQGEIVGLVGPTGSGKSTLLQCLNGLIMPEEGEVKFLGKSIKEFKSLIELRKNVSLLFQNPEDQIFERYVGDEIAYAALNFGISLSKIRSRLKELLGSFGFEYDFKNRVTTQLSGGEKRIVAFLSIVIHDPKVLVLDEPTASLDSENKSKLIQFLKNWVSNTRGVLFVSHNMNEVLEICDRVYIINKGKIINEGKVPEIFFDVKTFVKNGMTPPELYQLIYLINSSGFKINDRIKSKYQFIDLLKRLSADAK